MLLESHIEAIAHTAPNRLVGLYLMASYLYYCDEQYAPILSDNAYDLLCVHLGRLYPQLHHPHKHLIRIEEGKVSSNFTMRADQYPLIVQHTAIRRSLYPHKFFD